MRFPEFGYSYSIEETKKGNKMDREERLKRQKEFLINVAFFSVCAALVWVVFKAAGSVLLPFVLAFLIAALLSLPIRWLTEKLHVKRGIIAVVVVLFFYVLVVCLVYFVGSRLLYLIYDTLNEMSVFFAEDVLPVMQNLLERVGKILNAFSPVSGGNAENVGTEEELKKVGEVFSKLSESAVMGVSKVATGIPGYFMQTLIAVIATVFTELEFPSIMDFLRRQIPEKYQKRMGEGKNYVTGTLAKCVLSYCLIFGMTFLELWVGLALLGINGAVVIAFIIAVLDILPVLGTGTVLLPWSVVGFMIGNLKIGAGILFLYLIITVVRNIVEPKLVGRQMGLSPVVMLPCMLVGLKLFGIIGLFGVPFGVAFLKGLNDQGVIHIFNKE